MGLLGHMVVLFLVFKGISILFSMGFPGNSAGKESSCSAGHLHSMHGLERAHAVQDTCIQCMDWKEPLEKGTDTHSNILA